MNFTPSLGNILLVDDDTNITELLCVNLRSEGYNVDVETVAENVHPENLDHTTLVIVDAMRQPYSGMDLIYDIKDDPRSEHVAVILFSDLRSERMTIDALDAGADDYIVKPFSLRVLLAKVKSILRRNAPRQAGGSTIDFGDLTVDLISQTAKLGAQPLQLTKTEYAILVLLLKNEDKYISRIEIHRAVWDAETAGANERIVDTNISRLRKKLGHLGQYLISRTGHGYMLSQNI